MTFTTAVLTEAAHGSLKPPPTRRLRRVLLHLSYSMALSRLLDTTPPRLLLLAASRDHGVSDAAGTRGPTSRDFVPGCCRARSTASYLLAQVSTLIKVQPILCQCVPLLSMTRQ